MRISLALLASTFLCAATPALADCSDTITIKAASGYILKDVGVTASKDPVVQVEGTRTCGKISYDIFLSGGPAGKTANEIDLSLYYDTVEGIFKIQLSGQYYFVNLGRSLFKPKDDIVEFYGDVSVPITRGKVTVAPVFRVVEMVGVKDLPSLTLLQPGGRISFQPISRVTVSVDGRYSINVTQGYATVRGSLTGSYQATERLSFNLSWEDTDRTGHVVSAGLKLHL
ncbi:MAG: hypothetical protein V4480_01940 [Patescibacteria group bacterium]